MADVIALTLESSGKHVVAAIRGFINSFGPYLAACKSAGGTYDPVRRAWKIECQKVGTLVAELEAGGLEVDVPATVAEATKGASRNRDREQAEIDRIRKEARTRAQNAVSVTKGHKPFPYQIDGVEWLASRESALLADEMGLGKTLQALLAISEDAPVVIVCPAVAKGVWKREIREWLPKRKKVTVLSGRKSFRWAEIGEIVIVNYDILPAPAPVSKGKEWEVLPDGVSAPPHGTVLVYDEAHNLKNSKAKRTRTARQLNWQVRKNGGKTWLLTATPLLNHPPELWSLAQALGMAKRAWGGWKSFMSAFNGYEGRWGVQWGTTPTENAAIGLSKFQLRRLRLDVLPELPGKIRTEVEVEVGKVREADKAIKLLESKGIDVNDAHAIAKATRKDGAIFEQMSKARAALAAAKMAAVMAMVEEYEEQEQPLVVFSAHRVVDVFAEREGWAVITGDTRPEDRTLIEDQFQAGKLKGVAGTIQAMGVAITLTHAHEALFVDLAWTPALNDQAEDRICRIGQTRGCLITRLVANHAIDHRNLELLSEKQSRIDGSVEKAHNEDHELEEVITVEVKEIEEAQQEADKADKAAQAKGRKPKGTPKRRYPRNAQEAWVSDALLTLAALDPDRAGILNNVGFNGADTDFGHSLAEQVSNGLSDKQWAVAIKMCRKYHRQVGRCPEEQVAV